MATCVCTFLEINVFFLLSDSSMNRPINRLLKSSLVVALKRIHVIMWLGDVFLVIVLSNWGYSFKNLTPPPLQTFGPKPLRWIRCHRRSCIDLMNQCVDSCSMELFCVASVQLPSSDEYRWRDERQRSWETTTVSLQWSVVQSDHMPLYVSIVCVDVVIMTWTHTERWKDLIAYLMHFKEVPECSYFIVIAHQMITVHYSFTLRYLCASTAKWERLVFLTVRVDSRFRSKPRVFISTLLSESDSKQNKWSVPKHRTISPFIFWSAWNAMFWTYKHKVLYCNNLRIQTGNVPSHVFKCNCGTVDVIRPRRRSVPDTF